MKISAILAIDVLASTQAVNIEWIHKRECCACPYDGNHKVIVGRSETAMPLDDATIAEANKPAPAAPKKEAPKEEEKPAAEAAGADAKATPAASLHQWRQDTMRDERCCVCAPGERGVVYETEVSS